jgi:hypothetical protein
VQEYLREDKLKYGPTYINIGLLIILSGRHIRAGPALQEPRPECRAGPALQAAWPALLGQLLGWAGILAGWPASPRTGLAHSGPFGRHMADWWAAPVAPRLLHTISR